MFIKICGVTNADDALLAAGLGADAVGLIFAASPRRISPGVARDIVRLLPPEILSIGVFRNENRSRVVELANKIGLRAVQLHGNESADDTKWIASRVSSVIRAFPVTNPAIEKFQRFAPARLLIDSTSPGSGETFDWTMLDRLNISEPYILAGGLNSTNVSSAIQKLRPWGVDVSSGVERRPGHKDAVKMRKFINEARAAANAIEPAAGPGNKPFNWADDRTWK